MENFENLINETLEGKENEEEEVNGCINYGLMKQLNDTNTNQINKESNHEQSGIDLLHDSEKSNKKLSPNISSLLFNQIISAESKETENIPIHGNNPITRKINNLNLVDKPNHVSPTRKSINRLEGLEILLKNQDNQNIDNCYKIIDEEGFEINNNSERIRDGYDVDAKCDLDQIEQIKLIDYNNIHSNTNSKRSSMFSIIDKEERKTNDSKDNPKSQKSEKNRLSIVGQVKTLRRISGFGKFS